MEESGGTTEKIGERICKQRKRKRLTQQELADKMYIPKSTISAYENNKVDIKESVIIELSKHLDTTPNYLLGYETSNNRFINEALELLQSIKDEKVQEILIVQMKAIANTLEDIKE